MPATFQNLLGQIRGFYSQGNTGSDGSTGDGSSSGTDLTGGGSFGDPGTISVGFLPIGGDPGTTGGGGTFTTGFPVGTTTTTTTATPATSASFLNNFLQYFTSSGCGIGDFFLRIAFFILGFIAIIGAIYLYKGSDPVLRIPTRIAHGVVRAGKTAAKEIGEVAAE